MASLDGNQEDKKPQAGDEAFVGGDLNQQEAVGQPQGENLSTSSSSTMVAGQQAPQAADAQQEGSAAGDRFRNLRKYIDRSKTNMAGKIGAGLDKQDSNIGKQIGTEKSKLYGAEGQGGLIGKSQDFWANKDNKYKNVGIATDTIEKDHVTLSSEGNAGDWKKTSGGVVDDLSIQNSSGITSGLSNLNESAQQLATEDGRFQSLRNTMGRGREYGAGAQKLDQLLLQTKKPELDKLTELRKNVGKVTGQEFRDLVDRQKSDVGTIEDTASKVSQNIDTALLGEDGLLKTTEGEMETNLNDTREQDLTEYNTLMERIKKGEFTQEELDSLGIDVGEGFYGVNDLTNYVTKGDATMSNLLSEDDAIRYNSLNTLADNRTAPVGFNIVDDEVGNYKGTDAGLDQLALDLANQKQSYADKKDPITTSEDLRSYIEKSGMASSGLFGVGTPTDSTSEEEKVKFKDDMNDHFQYLKDSGQYADLESQAITQLGESLDFKQDPDNRWGRPIPRTEEEKAELLQNTILKNSVLGYRDPNDYSSMVQRFTDVGNDIQSSKYRDQLVDLDAEYRVNEDSQKASIYDPNKIINNY